MKRARQERCAKVVNFSKGTVIVERALLAETFFGRARGLLFRPQISGSTGMFLKPCNWVHTFGMKYPIDLIYVDSSGRIIKTVTALAPNRFGPFVAKSSWVLELPAYWLRTSMTSEGDYVNVVFI